jgi:hypothetical protein
MRTKPLPADTVEVEVMSLERSESTWPIPDELSIVAVLAGPLMTLTGFSLIMGIRDHLAWMEPAVSRLPRMTMVGASFMISGWKIER